MSTKHVRIRVPDDLMDEIAWEMQRGGMNQSQAILSLIERGLRKPEIEKSKDLPGWYQRNHERTYFLGRIEQRRAQVRELRTAQQRREA